MFSFVFCNLFSFFFKVDLAIKVIYPALILLDPDPMSLGTFSPPPGIGLTGGAGATVEGDPDSTTGARMKKI